MDIPSMSAASFIPSTAPAAGLQAYAQQLGRASQGAGAAAKAGAADGPNPEEKEVAGQFEAMLMQHLLSGMRAGDFSSHKDFARQTFEQMFDEEVARAVSEQGLGLGDTLFAPNASSRPQEVLGAADRGKGVEPR